MPGDLPTTYPDPLGPVPRSGVGSEHQEVRPGSSTRVQFCSLPVRPTDRSSPTNPRTLESIAEKTSFYQGQRNVHSRTVHVPDRSTDSYGKTGVVGSPSYEAHSVASEATLACSGDPREGHSGTQIPSSSSGLVVKRRQCPSGSATTSSRPCSAIVYRRLKRRLGHSFKRRYCQRCVVRPRKLPPHKCPRTEGSLSGPQELQASLQGSDCVSGYRQHNYDVLYQQGGRYEVRLSLCPPVEDSVLVPSQQNCLKGQTHSGSLECNSRQVIQASSGDSNRVVPFPGVQSLMLQVGQATRFNKKLPKYVSPVPYQAAWAVDALNLQWETLEVYAFPPVSLLGKVLSKVIDQGCHRMILIAPGWPNMAWFWDLVTLSSQIPLTLPLQKDLVTQPFNGVCHRNLHNPNLHVWLLEPPRFKNKVSQMKWQQELKRLKDLQPEPSINQSGPFLSNGVSHIRWTSGRPL